MHDVDLGAGRADRERVGVVALRAAHDVVRRSGTLAERDLHLRDLAVLGMPRSAVKRRCISAM